MKYFAALLVALLVASFASACDYGVQQTVVQQATGCVGTSVPLETVRVQANVGYAPAAAVFVQRSVGYGYGASAAVFAPVRQRVVQKTVAKTVVRRAH